MALLLLLSGFCFFFRFPGPGMVPDARGVTTPDGTGRNPLCAGVAAFGLCRGRYAHADTACLNSIAWGHNPRLAVLAAASRLRSLLSVVLTQSLHAAALGRADRAAAAL